jgi:hypothetical protein
VPRPDIEACPGAFINIGNAGTVGSCPVQNPHYNFNDAALPIGASPFRALGREEVATTIRQLTFVQKPLSCATYPEWLR